MSKNKNIDIVNLGTGHSLILGNLPPKVQLEQLNKILITESHAQVEAFGLFESSSPNYTTFYPDMKPEDLIPAEGDFIMPVFRALSSVIVHKKWNPIDFSVNDVLRPSMKLMQGQSIYVDHEMLTGNALGAVSEVAWQDASTAAGFKIPSGMNTVLKIDGKSNTRLARGITMDPPSIHSTSVTVEFEWEQSHPKMDSNEFWSKLGSFDEGGEMIRRVVTNIVRYHEISLVPHGADPFAQKIGEDGKIVNPRYAHISYNSAEERAVGAQTFLMDFKSISGDGNFDIISNGAIPNPPKPDIPPKQKPNNMKLTSLMIAMAAQMGMIINLKEGEDITPESAETIQKSFQKILTERNDSSSALSAAQLEAANLKKETEGLKPLQDFKTARLTEIRKETKKFYELALGTDKKQSVLDSIENSDYEACETSLTQYKELAEQAMPITCSECGSTECSRASAEASEEVELGDKGKAKKAKKHVVPTNTELADILGMDN